MSEKYIVVIGGCSVDETYFQLADGSYKSVPDFSLPGGKAANQAVAASRAGAKVKIITILGSKNAEDTKTIVDNLVQNNIDVSCIEYNEAVNNDVAKIYIEWKTRDNIIERQRGAIESFYPGLVQKYADVIKNASFVVAQMKAPKEFSIELINFCYSNNVPISVTPCRPERLVVSSAENVDLIQKITFITANQNECNVMFEGRPVEECVSMFPNKLIVTLGERGVVYHNDREVVHIPSVHVKNLVDTLGAGDTLAGNFAANLLENMTVFDALKRCTYASALAIQQKNAQNGMPTKEQLNQFIDEYNGGGFGKN